MKHARISAGLTATTLMAIGFAVPAHAGGVDAGTIISNTAEATYDAPGGPTTISSNTVQVAVDELLDVTAASLDGGPVTAIPGTAVLTFELTNTGNGPEAFTLTANPSIAGNDFDSTVDSIAIDTNGNGVYDPGVDQILSGPETTAELAEDEAVTVFVIVTVPSNVNDADESDVELVAEALTGTGSPGTSFAGQGVGGVDAIVGSTRASAAAIGSLVAGVTTINLVKSQSVTDPFGGSSAVPGAIITYTITANVNGSGSINNLVIGDTFPVGTTYSAGSIALDGAPLTDAAGDDAGEADSTGITVDLGNVAGGSDPAVSFDVIVN